MIARVLTGKELNLILRLILGVTFAFAAWEKVLHPQQFAISVRAYQIIPINLSNLFALATSWSELVVGCLLIAGLFTRKAAGATFILLAMFAAAIATVILRGMVVDCGCFGSDGASTGPLLLMRNVLLMAAAFLVMRFNDGFLGLDAAIGRPRRRARDTR